MSGVLATLAEPDVQRESPARVRSSVDLLRLVTGLVLIAFGFATAPLLDDALTDLSSIGLRAADDLPDWVRDVPGVVLTVAAGAVVGVSVLASLVTTRYRRTVSIILAVAAAGALSLAIGEAIYSMVDDATRQAFDVATGPVVPPGSWSARPGDPLLAGAVAAILVVGSFAPRGRVRGLTAVVVAYGGVRVLMFGLPAVGMLTDVGAGLVAASSVLLVRGRHDLSPTASEITSGLASIGIETRHLGRCSETTHPDRWESTTADGTALSIDAFGRDERSTDLLLRAWRWVRFRRPGGRRPFASLRRSVEHEALVSLQVAALGLRTPELLGLADVGRDGVALVYVRVPGCDRSASRLDADALTSAWADLRRLHDHRIAHRDLQIDNIIVDDRERVWLTGFGRSELMASDDLLALDRAQLLAATAAAIGNDAAIDAALASFDAPALVEMLPWLQPLALCPATRAAIGGDAAVADLRERAAERCGVGDVEPVRLQRITGTNLFLIATIGVGAWVLFPQLADVDQIWKEIRSASLAWAAMAVLCSGCSYVAATMGLLGAVPARLRFLPAMLAQLASSFANRLTPAKVGGLATNVRYFQRQGVPPVAGVAAVGLNAVAGVIVHILLTSGFLLLASGGNTSAGLSLPSTRGILIGATVVVSLAGASVALPAVRRLVTEYAMPHVRSGWTSIRTIGRSPVRLTMLFGGAALVTLSYLGAMVASLQAFGSTASFPIVGLLFLTGTAVSNAAPTPGGLGAAEAALLAAFSTVEDAEIVIPAVFLFRLVTFWLPILPGWLALNYLRRTDRL